MAWKLSWILEQVIALILLYSSVATTRILQFILDILCGPCRSDRLQKDTKLFRYKALLNTKVIGTQLSDQRLFLKTFQSLEDMTFVERDDVTLYAVEKDKFVFVKSRPGIDLYNGDEYPFFATVQHDATEEVLMASHEAVFRYIDSKPSQDGSNISLLYIIGRCGSTLMTQLVHCSGQVVSICGPNALDHVMRLSNEKDVVVSKNSVQDIKLIKTCLLLLAKDPETKYFIKVFPTLTGSMPHIARHALPQISEMFMYRALRPVLTSYLKLSGPIFSRRIGNYFINGLPLKYKRIWNKVKESDPQKKILFNALVQMHPFILEAGQRKNIKSYSYETLLENKEGFCKSLFRQIGIGEEHIPNGLRALDRDSQGKYAPLSRALLRKRSVDVAEEALEWARRIARDEFGIELTGPDCKITNFPNCWTSYEN